MDMGSDINTPFRYWSTTRSPRPHSVAHAAFLLDQPAERAEYFHRFPTAAENTGSAVGSGRGDLRARCPVALTCAGYHVRPVFRRESRPATAAPDCAHAPAERTMRSPAVPARSAAVPTGSGGSPHTRGRRVRVPLPPVRSPAPDTAARRTR